VSLEVRCGILMRIDMKTVYDISVTLGEESIDFPGDTPYSREQIFAPAGDGGYALSSLCLSAHSGTHLDAPSHFLPDGKNLDDFAVRDFILPAQVITIRNSFSIEPAELRQHSFARGHALLFKTENSRSGRCASGVFYKNYVYMTAEGADFCIAHKVPLLGIDYITIEKYGDTRFPVHERLLSKDILILEGLDLRSVSDGVYKLICLPLKIKNTEASPVRAALLTE
jgi:arylformamidase